MFDPIPNCAVDILDKTFEKKLYLTKKNKMNKRLIIFTLSIFTTTLFSQSMHIVNAGNYYYQPSELSINQGDSVRFINDDGYHDVVITSGPENLSLTACSGPCDIGFLVFSTPGEYDYICSIGSHSSLGMVGTITVNETNEIFVNNNAIYETLSPLSALITPIVITINK